jgi:beta-N-acetylhexosaminidase
VLRIARRRRPDTHYKSSSVATALLASLALAACGSSPGGRQKAHGAAKGPPTVASGAALPQDPASVRHRLGQLIVGRFDGAGPSGAFLSRVRAGELGGVILFAGNDTGSRSAVLKIVGELQTAAAAGHNPPLLIMTDQEGGEVKRLPWAPPALAPVSMDSGALARREGEDTGAALRSVGVNVDLAPVADIERDAGSFLGSRSFGSDPRVVAARACAFARGLEAAGVAYALKHFPGLGRAAESTDSQPVRIAATSAALRSDYGAYPLCGGSRYALVMVSSAIYPSLTGSQLPAVLSGEIYRRELPYATAATPVTISDDLQAGALRTESSPARTALQAGLDLLLYAQTEAGSAHAFAVLRGELRSGALSPSGVARAESAVAKLKELVAGAPTALAQH